MRSPSTPNPEFPEFPTTPRKERIVSHHDRTEFQTRRDAGLKARHAKRLARWVSVDEFLRAYDEQRDPDGHYGTPGRDPLKILSLKDAS